MPSRFRLSTFLRSAAVLLFVLTVATWLFTGAHAGWSRTSVTTMHHDEVTGIDYPVETSQFVAGVELLGAGLALALLLAAFGWVASHRSAARAARRGDSGA